MALPPPWWSLMNFSSSSASIRESPLLRAAKENDLCTLKKLQLDQNCDFRQRGEIRVRGIEVPLERAAWRGSWRVSGVRSLCPERDWQMFGILALFHSSRPGGDSAACGSSLWQSGGRYDADGGSSIPGHGVHTMWAICRWGSFTIVQTWTWCGWVGWAKMHLCRVGLGKGWRCLMSWDKDKILDGEF